MGQLEKLLEAQHTAWTEYLQARLIGHPAEKLASDKYQEALLNLRRFKELESGNVEDSQLTLTL